MRNQKGSEGCTFDIAWWQANPASCGEYILGCFQHVNFKCRNCRAALQNTQGHQGSPDTRRVTLWLTNAHDVCHCVDACRPLPAAAAFAVVRSQKANLSTRQMSFEVFEASAVLGFSDSRDMTLKRSLHFVSMQKESQIRATTQTAVAQLGQVGGLFLCPKDQSHDYPPCSKLVVHRTLPFIRAATHGHTQCAGASFLLSAEVSIAWLGSSQVAKDCVFCAGHSALGRATTLRTVQTSAGICHA